MIETAPIRVLVIDDSAFSRATITRMLESSPLIEVVATARDGDEALRMALELEPDAITLDLQMPRMDGFTFLRLLLSRASVPVIVVSSRVAESDVFQALELGAVDFIAKPSPRATPELSEIRDELIRKVHAVRSLRVDRLGGRTRPLDAVPAPLPDRAVARWPRLVAIGASTGGPSAVLRVLEAFDEVPAWPVVVAQHMPSGFTRGFAERIARRSPFEAREACEGDVVRPGRVLVAPGGANLGLERMGGDVVARLDFEREPGRCRPSVDRLFETAAKQYGEGALAIVLTGMGDDGKRGVRAIKDSGGSVIAESGESAVIDGMPRQAIRTGAVDRVVPLWDIPALLQQGRRP